MAQIPSLSLSTKRVLAYSIATLEKSISEIETDLDRLSISPDSELKWRIEIARRYQIIADLRVLVLEVPTLEETAQISTDYARQKLEAVNRAPEHLKQQVFTNALWRIASNAELFGDELSPDGSLTTEQATKVEQILEFDGLL